MIYVAIFFNAFVLVFLKAWQQQNVIHRQYWWILPTSMALAVCEVYLVVAVVNQGFGWIVVPMATGSGLGCMLSMYIHNRYRGNKK